VVVQLPSPPQNPKLQRGRTCGRTGEVGHPPIVKQYGTSRADSHIECNRCYMYKLLCVDVVLYISAIYAVGRGRLSEPRMYDWLYI